MLTKVEEMGKQTAEVAAQMSVGMTQVSSASPTSVHWSTKTCRTSGTFVIVTNWRFKQNYG